jgi:hypothetical protein
MMSFAHLGPKTAERVIKGAVQNILPAPYNKSMVGAERHLKRHLAKMDAGTLAAYLSEDEQKNLTETAARRARNKLYGEHIGRFRTKVANLVYKAIAKQIPGT